MKISSETLEELDAQHGDEPEYWSDDVQALLQFEAQRALEEVK